MTRTLSILVLALAVSAGLASTASARIAVGVGEQDYPPFLDAPWKQAGLKKSRVVVPWDVAVRRGGNRAKMDAFYRSARLNRVELLVAFNPSAGSRCPKRPCRRPSSRSYTRAFRAFRKRYRGIKVVAPWNEANHNTQPTYKSPKAAATYYNIVRKYCRGCKIIAADVIDESNMTRWIRTFRRYAKRPRIWGLHNYRDTNPRRGQKLGGTRKFLRTVRRGEVWLTETGGIVTFKLASGRTLFPTDEARANRATQRMFSLAKRYRKRIKRLYIYHWRQSNNDNRFDAGLISRTGVLRQSYRTVLEMLNGPQRKYFGR